MPLKAGHVIDSSSRPATARGLRAAARWTAALATALIAATCSGCGAARSGPVATAPPAAPAAIFRDAAREAGIDFHWGHGGRSPLNIIETLGHGAAFVDGIRSAGVS